MVLKRKDYFFLLFVNLVVLLFEYHYFYRYINWKYFILNTLWCEDARLFLNQALSLKYKSILKSYAGYLHTYPRLAAILATYFRPMFYPYILFIFSFIGVVIFTYMIFWFLKINKLSLTLCIFTLIVILQRPHESGLFFNITYV